MVAGRLMIMLVCGMVSLSASLLKAETTDTNDDIARLLRTAGEPSHSAPTSMTESRPAADSLERYHCIMKIKRRVYDSPYDRSRFREVSREFSADGEFGESCDSVVEKVRNLPAAKIFDQYGTGPVPDVGGLGDSSPPVTGAPVYCRKEKFEAACR